MWCFFKKKTIWTTWNQSRKTKQNILQGLWIVKERLNNSVCVHEAENLTQSSFEMKWAFIESSVKAFHWKLLLLAWWENRDQSPTASYNQLMSFFHLWRCSHTSLDSHSILESSDSGFCSTFYRRGKWDLGWSKDLLVMVAPACYLLSPQICCSRDREVRTSSAERYCCAS